MKKYGVILICLFLLASVVGIGVASQDAVTAYDLDWWTVDGGGGTSQSGAYELSGTAGQPDAGLMQGGTYTLAGGFWAGSSGSLNVYVPFVRRP